MDAEDEDDDEEDSQEVTALPPRLTQGQTLPFPGISCLSCLCVAGSHRFSQPLGEQSNSARHGIVPAASMLGDGASSVNIAGLQLREHRTLCIWEDSQAYSACRPRAKATVATVILMRTTTRMMERVRCL